MKKLFSVFISILFISTVYASAEPAKNVVNLNTKEDMQNFLKQKEFLPNTHVLIKKSLFKKKYDRQFYELLFNDKIKSFSWEVVISPELKPKPAPDKPKDEEDDDEYNYEPLL